MTKGRCLLPLLLCLCLTSCAPLLIFCAGTAAGIGGYKYYEGSLTVIYQAPYMETWDAALKALEDMEFTIKTKKHDLTSGKIVTKRADDKNVTVSLKYRSTRETKAVIRVGLFGDENASNVIKDQIGKELFK
ncbi:MAG: DUF3568 family protein [Deltaproteobacteria bacterium]|nr:DUF3568 family protein [Deltaproteobacteria bacterium]